MWNLEIPVHKTLTQPNENCTWLRHWIALDFVVVAVLNFFCSCSGFFCNCSCQGKIFSNSICTMWVKDRDSVQNPALCRPGPSPNFLVSLAEWILELSTEFSLIKSLIHIFLASNDLCGRTSILFEATVNGSVTGLRLTLLSKSRRPNIKSSCFGRQVWLHT